MTTDPLFHEAASLKRYGTDAILGGRDTVTLRVYFLRCLVDDLSIDADCRPNNDFAIALYSLLRRTPGNLLFSPLSLRIALGMALAGARGETATEMANALRLSSTDESIHAGLAEVVRRLQASQRDYEIAVANALWGQDGAPLEASFLDLIWRNYAGVLNVVEFRRDAGQMRLAINNAIYFKGTRVQKFNPAWTRAEPVRLQSGSTVRVPMMNRRVLARFVRAEGYQAVDLAYEGGDFSMLVLLPHPGDSLPDFEETISPLMIADCVGRLFAREVELCLPRFKLTPKTLDFGAYLRALGMTRSFDRSRADFSRINDHPPGHPDALFISSIYHKAFLEVNEAGTEAAAATAIGKIARRGAEPTPIFRADHSLSLRDSRSKVRCPFVSGSRHRSQRIEVAVSK
jgi:serpin B